MNMLIKVYKITLRHFQGLFEYFIFSALLKMSLDMKN